MPEREEEEAEEATESDHTLRVAVHVIVLLGRETGAGTGTSEEERACPEKREMGRARSLLAEKLTTF